MSPEIHRKRIWCADLKVGEQFHEVFCLARVERRAAGGRGPVVRLNLVDRTGELPGVVWDEIEDLVAALVEGEYVRVRGEVGEYRGERQAKVLAAEPVGSHVDPGEYLARGPVPAEESLAGIRALIDGMTDRGLRALMLDFLNDPAFGPDFAASPAAKRNHHAYVGGLAEHTRSVMELCARAAEHYPGVDRDLLLAGAFCHDIGKTRELAVAPGFPYTEEGELLGHIPVGFAMVRERAARLGGIAPDRVTDLCHLVLSHQGELEWGSPIQPRTLEAIVLHFIDNLDSKVTTARHHLGQVESGRTGWVPALGRALFRRGSPTGGPAPGEPPSEAPRGPRDTPSLFDPDD